jgi:capsular polysaccharide transport system permease protein
MLTRVGSFFASLAVQRRVILALMLRQMLSTYGREHLGAFWLVGDPLVLTAAVMILWSFSGGERGASIGSGGNGVLAFALTGYTIITLWRHISVKMMTCIRSNTGLMFHRNVHYLDTMISLGLLEAAGVAISFAIMYICLYVTGFIEPFYDAYFLIGGWLLSAWLSFAVGLVIAGATQLQPILERFVQPFMYVTLPLTGLFFMISWLPDNVARLMLYSPLAHCFELFRDGMFGHNVEAQWDVLYVIKCNIVTTALGLFLVHKARNSIRFEV